MFGLSAPLVVKPLVGVAVASALVFAGLDWRDARAARGALKACVAAAGKASKPLEGCPAPLARSITDARRSDACDTAIEAADLFGERSSCSAPVKRRGAQLSAVRAELSDVRGQLADAERQSLAAISRAEARATTAAKRKADAAATLAKAPRAADGLIDCDSDCLRGLSGSEAAGS